MTTNDPRKKPRQERPRAGDAPRCRLCGDEVVVIDDAGITRHWCSTCRRRWTPVVPFSERRYGR